MKKRIGILTTLIMVVSILQIPLCANAEGLFSTEKYKVQEITEGIIYKNYLTNINNVKSSHMGDEKASKDIVDIAISDGRFKTLVTALKSAELVDALKGEGPFTVFAPTDDAFAKLPKEKLDELLKPENKKALVDILKYHVVPSKVSSKDVIKLDGKEITMANGKKAKIKVKDGSVYINDVKVTTTDIMGKNGVIHVIDAVLIP
ncbi:fasciclin domain-containing protein [Clostridium taeniosporum]|nr:fasciclin domain-containing protein [Clostridium taeniosporum]